MHYFLGWLQILCSIMSTKVVENVSSVEKKTLQMKIHKNLAKKCHFIAKMLNQRFLCFEKKV